MKLLRVENLSKHFGGVNAISGLSFEVNSGEMLAVIGPNGAGKTTLFNLITGVFPPSEGNIYFKDQALKNLSPHHIAALGIARTFQNLQVFKNMTILENVMVGRHLKSRTGLLGAAFRIPRAQKEEKEIIDKALHCLELVGLADKAYEPSSSLPFGQQRLLEIARAVATEPDLLLLDEPAAGLNATESKKLVSIIRNLKKSGITMMMVEHDMETVMTVADRLVVLDFGIKIAQGTPDEIQSDEKVIAAYLGDEVISC